MQKETSPTYQGHKSVRSFRGRSLREIHGPRNLKRGLGDLQVSFTKGSLGGQSEEKRGRRRLRRLKKNHSMDRLSRFYKYEEESGENGCKFDPEDLIRFEDFYDSEVVNQYKRCKRRSQRIPRGLWEKVKKLENQLYLYKSCFKMYS